MKLGIVGLPNVGKSTLFNAITNAGAESANYPFCTIEPNIGMVAVPDERLEEDPRGHRIRRHRGSCQGRKPRCWPRQQVPGEHPPHGRHRSRRALLR